MAVRNLADVWEAVAARQPQLPALWDGHRVTFTWAAFERAAEAAAQGLAQRGLAQRDRLAILMRNQPEYLITAFACFKLGLTPLNLNYRYTSVELSQVLDTADCRTVVAGVEFLPLTQQLPAAGWHGDVIAAPADEGGETPTGVAGWLQVAGDVDPDRLTTRTVARSGDDHLLLFTGGTTGVPKGVVWRQQSLLELLAAAQLELVPGQQLDAAAPRPLLPAAPFMHGTGLFTSMGGFGLTAGGSVICLPRARFDPAELLTVAQRLDAEMLVITGNAMAVRLIETLERAPRELPGLRYVLSSGAVFSSGHKERLLAALPELTIIETLGASEGTNTGTAIAVHGSVPPTGRFVPGPDVRLLTPDGDLIPPGSGVPGLLAVGGPLPDGYFRDPEATARVYRDWHGVRLAVPGDWARGHPDGTLELLGRGSASINSGGEKIYPGEVEAAILSCPGVREAAVVGVPDDRFGESVCAVVAAMPGAQVSDEDIVAAVRATLARYKVPRHVVRVHDLPRTAVGKVHYPAVLELARRRLALEPS
ncbi:MAG TPA: AMP-binding protein [Mycobacteriales bacterium]|nr:AMP-binding protein [Mycobacteriales bacterium]